MAKSAIPNGPTEKIAAAGGESLFFELAVSMAGKDLVSCVYALTRAMSSLALNIDDINMAKAVLTQMSADAINEVELNWADRQQLIAEAQAHFHKVGGHG